MLTNDKCMHPGRLILFGLIVHGITTASCDTLTETTPSAAHAAFLTWAQERGYADLKPWPRRDSDGLCWVVCQSSAIEVWYKLGACPGEWFSIIHLVHVQNTWRVEEASYRDAPPEGISACRYAG
jgi:hypothetical protein